jgi:hypothetical protein
MKQNDAVDQFDRNFASVMKRLSDAGMIESYAMNKTPCVVWRRDYNSKLDGRAAFLGLATLLAQICPERPLSTDEQAVIQMIRQCEEDEPSPLA